MKVLVTGSDGQLGSALIHELKKRNIDFFAANRKNMNLEDEHVVKKILRDYAPNIVYHSAAFTNVDKAEEELDYCYLINVLSTKLIAQTCNEIGAKLVYISTDFIFDGESDLPYNPDDNPNPINYYGKTKYLRELEILNYLNNYFIVRTSWVYGNDGSNFVTKILNLAKTNNQLKVVNEEIGSPTYTVDLSKSLIGFTTSNHFGIYHIVNEGYCSRYEFAKKIIELKNLDNAITPVSSDFFNTLAKRPKRAILSQGKNPSLKYNLEKSWQTSLKHYLEILDKKEF